MQKDVQISENIFIQDLGSGYSYVNFNRRIEEIEDHFTGEKTSVIIAGEQYRLQNPATYERIVDAVVKEKYQDGADQAALRNGITDNTDEDFLAFNVFVEGIKSACKEELQ